MNKKLYFHLVEEEYSNKYSLGGIAKWLLVVVVIVFLGIYFKPINIWINKGQANATVIDMYSIVDINDQSRFGGLNISYMVTYMYTVNGKSYTRKTKMKLAPSLFPASKTRELGPADMATIPIVYCRHWPAFHYVKHQEIEWVR